jgi:hypothetical protein
MQNPIITVDQFGGVTVGVTEGNGKSCLEATRKIEEMLMEATKIEPTKVLTEDYNKESNVYLTEGF